MTASEVWVQNEKFIRGLAGFFHRKFPGVLELDEKVSIALIYADKAWQRYDPTKGRFETYAGTVIARGLLREINREIEGLSCKKHWKTHEILYSIMNISSFFVDDSHDHAEETVYAGSTSNLSRSWDEKFDAYRKISASPDGLYTWLHYVCGLPVREISDASGRPVGDIQSAIQRFRGALE